MMKSKLTDFETALLEAALVCFSKATQLESKFPDSYNHNYSDDIYFLASHLNELLGCEIDLWK